MFKWLIKISLTKTFLVVNSFLKILVNLSTLGEDGWCGFKTVKLYFYRVIFLLFFKINLSY